MAGVLYISYSGMLEPLGQSQVLAYQERLARDHSVHLISFERSEDWRHTAERTRVANRMELAGIHWHPLRYHKRPSTLATAWDIRCGTRLGTRLVRQHGLKIVHARSYVPSAMALAVKRHADVKYVFDMRGFWADERVDGGLWPRDGRMYRIAKSYERRFLLAADHVVSLTHAAVREIQSFAYLAGRIPPMTVIPTCADLDRFKPQQITREGFVLGYVGSAGTWYLFDAVVESFRQLLDLRPDARMLIVNRNEHDYIRQRLKAADVPEDRVEILACAHADVPKQIARMHAAVFFIKPVYSKQASAPTKLGEFLGCGIPCLSNSGVGDMAEVLEGDGVGVTISAFDASSMRDGVARLVDLSEQSGIQTRCVASARRHFSLNVGVARYATLYKQVDEEQAVNVSHKV